MPPPGWKRPRTAYTCTDNTTLLFKNNLAENALLWTPDFEQFVPIVSGICMDRACRTLLGLVRNALTNFPDSDPDEHKHEPRTLAPAPSTRRVAEEAFANSRLATIVFPR